MGSAASMSELHGLSEEEKHVLENEYRALRSSGKSDSEAFALLQERAREMKRKRGIGDPYSVLGIERDASPNEVKKAYRKLCLAHHPDKGGDTEKFQKINQAYEAITNPERGDSDAGSSSAKSDIFDHLFGRRSGAQESVGRKTANMRVQLKVTLEMFHSGSTRRFSLSRRKLCSSCEISSCSTCQGNGIRTMIRQIGPGMVQQIQMECSDCNRRGYVTTSVSGVCSFCEGNGVGLVKETVSIYVEKGMYNGDKITLSEKGDEAPGCIAGDVTFVLAEEKHARFTRKGPDLLVKLDISLKQALCGFVKILQARHLKSCGNSYFDTTSLHFRPSNLMCI
jgi:DnaJ-class molecular chaperone